MRIDVDKKAGKTALTEALSLNRRVRNHSKRHAVGGRKSRVKQHRKNIAILAKGRQKKRRAKLLARERLYWSGERNDLRS